MSLEDAHLDRSGYYALARLDPDNHDHPRERQLDFFGGLRWRYEEHIPAPRRKIDRIALFRAKPGLELREDHIFNDEEYNTYRLPLAPQHDGGGLFVPHGQGAQGATPDRPSISTISAGTIRPRSSGIRGSCWIWA